MFQPFKEASFFQEAISFFWRTKVRVQLFNSNSSFCEDGVLTLKYVAKAPTANFVSYTVVAKGLANEAIFA